jgi:hypothetical protein
MIETLATSCDKRIAEPVIVMPWRVKGLSNFRVNRWSFLGKSLQNYGRDHLESVDKNQIF